MSMPWYGELPERWTSTRIKNIFSLRDERNILPMDKVRLISLYTHLGVIPHEQLEKTTGNRAATVENYKNVYEGDIIVNIILCWQGAVGLSQWNGVTSPAYDVYRPRTDNVCGRYYHYLFRLPRFSGECYRYGHGIMAMRWRTYSDEFTAIRVPFPPRDEQDQIIRYLDWKVSLINKLINAKRRQIALLQEQKQAIINETVTKCSEDWQDISLGNLGTFRKGFGSSRADDVENGGVACIRYGDIYRCGALFLFEPITRITTESSTIYARVYKSEVLFTLSGETKEEIGQALVNCIDEDTWCSGDVAIFTSNESISPAFLMYALRCPHIVQQRASMAKGDIIVHISMSSLRRLKISVPPIEQQHSIVLQLDTVSTAIEEAVKTEIMQIVLLSEYRTCLISDVVTGKLDVRGVVVPAYGTVEEIGDNNNEPFDENVMEDVGE